MSPRSASLLAPDEPVHTRATEVIPDRELMLLVYHQMRTLVGPRPELDDLVQTALEQLLVARFEGRCKFTTFTHAVCYRVWMKHLRWKYRWRRVFQLSLGDQVPDAISGDNPLSKILAQERLQHFYAALDKVSPKRRAVVILRDLGGEDIAAIATIVNANELTVRSRLRDGRKQLCELLQGNVYFEVEASLHEPAGAGGQGHGDR
jgi:RNA polymerase sigma factor (sigma-70 family)